MWNWLQRLFGSNGKARRDPLDGWDGIHREATPGDPPRPRWKPGGPPPDYSREDATYRREAERLARDHLGKIALIHNDEVAGIYDDPEEAFLDGYKRFGDVKLMVATITDSHQPPEWVSFINPDDPHAQWVERPAQPGAMAKFITSVDDYLILPAAIGLPLGMERERHRAGQRVPADIPVRLILDTGSKRSTLQPRVLDRLDPEPSLSVRLTTPVDNMITRLYWVCVEFPVADLFSIGHLEVARVLMPCNLTEFDGILGRDVLSRWESFHWQGRRGRLTIRDVPGWWRWLRR